MSVDLTPEVLDGIEARAKEANDMEGGAWPDTAEKVETFCVSYPPDAAHIAGLDPDTALALVAAAREREELRAVLNGRCLADITHRDEGHRQSVCILAAPHTTAHDDGMGCTWTDAEHHGPSELDELRATVARVEALHAGNSTSPTSDHYYCEWGECDRSGEGELQAYCDECGVFAPCDTAKALRGESE